MDEDEASQAAYCLLAMSRGCSSTASDHRLSCKGGEALSAALGHETLMEQPAAISPYSSSSFSSAPAIAIPAAATHRTSPNRNAGVVVVAAVQQQESPFMIARILTDLTRVRQDLFSVEPLQQATPQQQPPPPSSSSCNSSGQRNQGRFTF